MIQKLKPTCAICVGEIDGEPNREPLGKDDALVNVCAACATEPPRAYDSPRGYNADGDGISLGEMMARMCAFAAEHHIDERPDRAPSMRPRTPGWLLVRVSSRAPGGATRDFHEAAHSLADKPWARELRFLGSTSAGPNKSWLLFERPDPSIADRFRVESPNPLAWLEEFRSEPEAP